MAVLARRAAKSNDFQLLCISFPSWSNIDPWIRSHFRYATEPYEIIMSPELSLQRIEEGGYFVGDCDDVATFEAAIYKAYGFPVRFVAIRTFIHDRNFQHVYLEVFINNIWVRFDPTVRVGLIHREFGRMELNV